MYHSIKNNKRSQGIALITFCILGEAAYFCFFFIPVPARNPNDSMSAQYYISLSVSFRRPFCFDFFLFCPLFFVWHILGRGPIAYPWRDISNEINQSNNKPDIFTVQVTKK